MTRVSLLLLMLACAGWALAVALGHPHSGDETHPPSPGNHAAWQWAAAEAGANIYVYPVGSTQTGSLASAWVDREFSSGLASVGVSVMQLRQFDCERRASRQLGSARPYRDFSGSDPERTTTTPSGWRQVTPGTVTEQVLSAACSRPGVRVPDAEPRGSREYRANSPGVDARPHSDVF